MRHILTAAAAIAVCGMFTSVSAEAQTYVSGGPRQAGNMCRVSTFSNDSDYYGYWAPCAPQAAAAPRKKHSR
jgi:hypothetical protein